MSRKTAQLLVVGPDPEIMDYDQYPHRLISSAQTLPELLDWIRGDVGTPFCLCTL